MKLWHYRAFRLPTHQAAMHRLTNPADRQPILCRHRVRRTVPDRANKVVDRIDTEAAGDTVAVVDKVTVGRKRLIRGGDFQPPVLRGVADIRRPAEDIDAPVVVFREPLRQYPRILDHP